MSRFQKATREQLKLRMALDGPSGSGKTWTALLFALALGKKIAVIDTENGSALKYQGETVDGLTFDFFHAKLTNYAPTEYTAAIKEAGREGFDVIIVDSLSHAWAGEGGALELKDAKGGNQYTAWKDITPMHNRMVEAILKSPCHVIATMRSKQDYVLEDDVDRNGKAIKVPRKIGMAPIQRPGMEYEFDVYGCMDWTHTLKVTKSRCPSVDDAVMVKPGATFMIPIIEWLNSGIRQELQGKSAPSIRQPISISTFNAIREQYNMLTKAGLTAGAWKDMLAPFGVGSAKDLSEDDSKELLDQCTKLTTLAISIEAAKPADAPEGATESLRAIFVGTAAADPHSNGSDNSDIPDPTPPAMCSQWQAAVLDTLFGELGYTKEKIFNGMKKLYGIDCQDGTKVYSLLTAAQADDLISRLTSKKEGQRQAT